MPVSATQVSVGTSPVLLMAADSETVVSLVAEAGAVYLGDASVTSTSGCLLDAPYTFKLHGGDEIFGVVASGSGTVGVIAVS